MDTERLLHSAQWEAIIHYWLGYAQQEKGRQALCRIFPQADIPHAWAKGRPEVLSKRHVPLIHTGTNCPSFQEMHYKCPVPRTFLSSWICAAMISSSPSPGP